MQAKDIYEKLQQEFGESIISFHEEEHSDSYAIVEPAKLRDICLFLRDEEDLDFDYLACLSGVDFKSKQSDDLGVVYHLYSVALKHTFVLKVVLGRETPKVPTVENVWKAANWHEREAYDMYGVVFEDHPNLIRILTPYDWEGYPLRKDYKEPDEYNGIKVPY